jgi:glutathione S-transferase
MSEGAITLHHCPQTRSMRVLWLLGEMGVEFSVVEHAFDRSLRDPAYLALSPAGRVPALEIDSAVMFESGAMIEYLCEWFPIAGLARAPGDRERIDWLVWVHFAETLSQHTAALTQQHVALFEDAMRSPVVMKLEVKRQEKCFAAIEARLNATKGGYLLAGGFSAADVCVGQAVYMARHFSRIEPFAALAAWYQRITARPAFLASLPADGARLYDQTFYEAWDG